jgi:hypothetical protein
LQVLKRLSGNVSEFISVLAEEPILQIVPLARAGHRPMVEWVEVKAIRQVEALQVQAPGFPITVTDDVEHPVIQALELPEFPVLAIAVFPAPAEIS